MENCQGALAVLASALQKYPHPPLRGVDFSWLSQTIHDLPGRKTKNLEQRKEERWATATEMEAIPDAIARERLAIEKRPSRGGSLVRTAISARNEMVFRIVTWVPLRLDNLCHLTIGSRENGANIFKAALPRLKTLDKPLWALELLDSNPKEQFWQLYVPETKNDEQLRSILPRDVATFLEEYVVRYWPALCKSANPGPLFPSSRTGKSLSRSAMYTMIINMTHHHVGTAVNPHLIRDIEAVGAADRTGGNLLIAARLLGDRSTATVEKIYVSKFDLSHALRQLEELRERERSGRASVGSNRPSRVIVLARELITLLRESKIDTSSELEALLARLMRMAR
jgi:hypothetical protein